MYWLFSVHHNIAIFLLNVYSFRILLMLIFPKKCIYDMQNIVMQNKILSTNWPIALSSPTASEYSHNYWTIPVIILHTSAFLLTLQQPWMVEFNLSLCQVDVHLEKIIKKNLYMLRMILMTQHYCTINLPLHSSYRAAFVKDILVMKAQLQVMKANKNVVLYCRVWVTRILKRIQI